MNIANRCFLGLFLFTSSVALSPIVGIASDESAEVLEPAAKQQLIEQLVKDLGHNEYLVRRDAESRLMEFGADAFNALQKAEQSSDLEIATHARYLLYQIRVQWLRPDDSPKIRSVMTGYGELPAAERRDRITLLENMQNHEGLGALCRIARFDPAPKLTRLAAMKVLRGGSNRKADHRNVILQEIDQAQTIPAQWLRTYTSQMGAARRFDSRWLKLLDEELVLFQEESEETDLQTVLDLQSYLLDLADQLGDSDAIYATLRRRVDLLNRMQPIQNSIYHIIRDKKSPLSDLIYSLQQHEGTTELPLALATLWVIDQQHWEVQRSLEQEYAQAFQGDRLLIYLAGIAASRQGWEDQAENYANRALSIMLANLDLHNKFADIIGELGHYDWAEQEWKAVIDASTPTDSVSLSARRSLATMRLNDREAYQEAADLLGESIDAIENDPDTKSALLKDPNDRFMVQRFLPSQRAYYLAALAKDQGNLEQQREHLLEAMKFNPNDPDILIAMYHAEEANDDFKKTVTNRIKSVAHNLELSLKKQPNNQYKLNEYAWLISNTEGNYEKALECSLRSLELVPGSASYLDTLGRCYYAVGDLEKAIEFQTQAVAKQPHLQVMQRQLALFKSELAQKQ